jgi:hypothetical protein
LGLRREKVTAAEKYYVIKSFILCTFDQIYFIIGIVKPRRVRWVDI